MDVVGVVATLAGHHDVALRECLQVIGVLQHAGRSATDQGTVAARLRRAEEDRVDVIEVALDRHALHEHRAHHATPANDCSLHSLAPAARGPLR